MARHELGEAVGDGDDRLAEVAAFDAGGAQQGAGSGHVAAMGDGARAEYGHGDMLRGRWRERKTLRMLVLGVLARLNL
ncbi:hypothetical protein GCM10027415_35620 [Humibacter ginsengisoli]